jgi:Gelsolin repeat
MGLESYGQFCTVDAYIVLVSTMGDKELEHSVYTWIGNSAQTDKKFCCAMYAVSLRNMVQSTKRIGRMTEGDEGEEFLKVFEGSVVVLDAGYGTETGLFMVQERVYPVKMYRVDGKCKPFLVLVRVIGLIIGLQKCRDFGS